MKLLTLGDSFTYGLELSNPENTAWPVILGQRLGYEVVNAGQEGISNEKIIENLLLSNVQNFDLVIILWTNFDRFEIVDEFGQFTMWPGGHRRDHRQLNQFRPSIIDYWNRHHNDTYLYRQYLKYVILAQSYIKQHGKKYLMADAFGNHLDPGRSDPRNQDLIKQIDLSKFLGWPDQSSMEWVGDAPCGPGLHYLEQGHEIVATKFYNHLTHDI